MPPKYILIHTTMNTAIIYSRVSTKEQSNEKQIEQLTDYCNRNGLEIKGVYSEKVSGAATEKEVLDGIIYGEPMADVLIIREISRLSRENDVWSAGGKIKQLSEKYTIIIVADNRTIEKGSLKDNMEGLVLFVKLMGAADEREKIAMRVSEARARYAKNPTNYAYGGLAFGLEKVPNPEYVKGINTKSLIQPSRDFEKVIQVYTLKSSGLSNAQIARNVSITESLVHNILRNKKIRLFLPEGLADAADEGNRKNNSRTPSPSKHANMYKGIIFSGDTDKPMHHQCTSKGNRYERAGVGVITDDDLNETVLRALQSFVVFFNVEKDEVVKERDAKIKQIQMAIDTNAELIKEREAELELLRQKALKSKDVKMYERIEKEINKKEKTLEDTKKQIHKWNRDIKRLNSIQIENEEVTLENLETYVSRYVKAVRYYPVKPFVRIIRVEIKEEYLPAGANNYKDYEVCRNWKNHYITPLEIKYANESLQHYGVEIEVKDENDNWSVNPSVYYSND